MVAAILADFGGLLQIPADFGGSPSVSGTTVEREAAAREIGAPSVVYYTTINPWGILSED